MPLIAKVQPVTRAERWAEYFRQALNTSDAAVYSVHQRVSCEHELYEEIFELLDWKDRSMIRDIVSQMFARQQHE